MYRKKGRSWTKHIDFMLLDVLCMQIAFIVSYICRFGLNNPYIDKDYRILAVAFLLIDFFVEIVSDAFKNVLKRGYLDEFIVTCKHVALVEIITTFFLFTTQMGEIYSRMSYYIMIPIYILVSYLGRMVLKKIIKKRGFASSKESLFVIAPEKLLEETLQGLKENGFGYTQIVAAATDADLNGKTICEIPIVANHDGIVDYACEEWVDEVLIPPCAESEYPYEMADIFLEMGIAVHRGITKNKVMAGSFNQIEKIGDYTVITASLNYARTTQLLAKRGMDILGGLVGCIITLIVTIFVGPAIYIASPGPIFFAQERIGRNGRKFKMYKFRSMYMDAEERKKDLMAQNKVSDGMMFKMDFDPRIIGNKILPDGTKKTGIGQFIRKTSIDELPQFWNILKGDMSLVGTRPPTLDEWEKYEPHHRARMSFRPGLTGLWQVSGRSNITDFEEVVRLDTQYIGEWSVKNDIRIIFQTIIRVMKNDGAVYSKTKPELNLDYLKYGLKIALPLVLHSIALQILSQSDRVMITSLRNAAETGVYSLVYNLSMIATVITTSLDGIWVPWFTGKLKERKIREINVLAMDYVHLMTYAMAEALSAIHLLFLKDCFLWDVIGIVGHCGTCCQYFMHLFF